MNLAQPKWLLRAAIGYKNRPSVKLSRVDHPELIDPSASVRWAQLKGPITLGERVRINPGVRINGSVDIGRYTSINGPNTDISSLVHHIRIGAFTSIARNVTVQEYNHHQNRCSTSMLQLWVMGEDRLLDVESRGGVEIGHDVWIASHVVVTSGAKIGTGAIVGANSTVTGEIPPYSVAVGSPAKVLRPRFPEEVSSLLLESEWWDWPIETIRKHKKLFSEEMDLSIAQELVGIARDGHSNKT